jgi:hypothetical protein
MFINSDILDSISQGIGLSFTSISGVINSAILYLFPIVGLVLLVYLIYGGFEVMTSAGDPKKIASGRLKITYSLLGFLIMFAAFWIVQLLAIALGLPDITDIFAG